MVYSLYLLGGNGATVYPSPVMTINGVSQLADFCYAGGNAGGCSISSGWKPFRMGSVLPLSGSGSIPVVHPHNTLMQAGKAWQAGSALVGDIALEDFVLELILRVSSTTNIRCFSKRSYAGGSGLRVIHQIAIGTAFLATFQSGGTSVNVGGGSAALAGDVVHAMLIADRSGSAQWAINGSLVGSPVNISSVGTMANAVRLVLGGGDSDISQVYDDRLMWAALWKRADWLDTHAQSAVAATRYVSVDLGQFLTYGPQLLVDGDAEASGVAAWTAANDAALSKDTTAPYQGSQSLRIAYGGTAMPYASQTVLTAGKLYRVTGVARGDNSVAPRLMCGASQTIKSFTTDAGWQVVDETFDAADADLRLYCVAASAGHAEFDKTYVREVF
jgi:hypothetical protein